MFAELVVGWILAMIARTPCEGTGYGNDTCEQYIKPYVEWVFEDHPVTTPEAAVQVAWCESRWNPDGRNPSSTASGLYQYLRGTWRWETDYWGWAAVSDPSNRFDPVLATQLTYRVVERDGGWRQWACRPR